jgi:transposase
MPAERVSMRRIREVLRLKHEGGASDRQIARSLSLARSTVALTLERVAAAGLRWPLPVTLSDRVLEGMLYAGNGRQQGERRKAEPDWAHVHHELRRPGVTLMLLWEEYRQHEPDSYGYSRWCELYRAWEGRLSPTMRQAHPAGERLFVDYAGQTVDVVDPGTGEVRPAQIFVAVMGASNYTYAEATATQSLPDWIGAHVRALAFMGGVPAQLVPDNPKSLPLRRRGSGSIAPIGTSPASTGPISISPPITAPQSCRRGPESRGTRYHEDWLQRSACVQARRIKRKRGLSWKPRRPPVKVSLLRPEKPSRSLFHSN